MKLIPTILIFLFGFLSAGFGQQRLMQARVLRVHDGDGCRVQFVDSTFRQEPVHVRFPGVDCPEVTSLYIRQDQPYGRQAGEQTRSKISGKFLLVRVDPAKPVWDKFGRMVAECYFADTDTTLKSLSTWLLETGAAWYLDRGLPKSDRKAYKKLETDARKAGLGLWGWKDPANTSRRQAPIRPGKWRKDHYRG